MQSKRNPSTIIPPSVLALCALVKFCFRFIGSPRLNCPKIRLAIFTLRTLNLNNWFNFPFSLLHNCNLIISINLFLDLNLNFRFRNIMTSRTAKLSPFLDKYRTTSRTKFHYKFFSTQYLNLSVNCTNPSPQDAAPIQKISA